MRKLYQFLGETDKRHNYNYCLYFTNVTSEAFICAVKFQLKIGKLEVRQTDRLKFLIISHSMYIREKN